MSNSQIWRYLSLSKYVDLLRTQAVYFPKAALFQDETEGKWWGHATLHESAEKCRQVPANIKTLEEMLARAGQDQEATLAEITRLIPTANEWVQKILIIAKQCFPNKRREFLEFTISGWKRLYDDHNKSVTAWRSDLAVERESTYISCWNRATSMSLAMWEMYELNTPDGRRPLVRTVWQLDAGQIAPRLITAYPLEKEI